MHTPVRPTLRRAGVSAIAAFSFVLVAGPPTSAAHASTTTLAAQPAGTVQQASSLIQQGKLSDAQAMLEGIVEAQPSNGQAVFFLGYALHAQGKLDEALAMHKRAAEFAQVKPQALYNIACVYAMQEKPDDAFAALFEAIDAGFRDASNMRVDGDLASLKDDERFDEALQRIVNPPQRLLRFWVGEWDCYSASNNALSGSNTLELRGGGRIIHEQWIAADGSTGESWNWFNPATKTWRQTWIGQAGDVTDFHSTPKGKGVLFEGDSVKLDGSSERIRMWVRPIEDGRVQQTGTRLAADGERWEARYDLIYVPKGEAFLEDAEDETEVETEAESDG